MGRHLYQVDTPASTTPSTSFPTNDSNPVVSNGSTDNQSNNIALGVGIGVGIPALVVSFCAWWFPRHAREKKKAMAEEKGKGEESHVSGSQAKQLAAQVAGGLRVSRISSADQRGNDSPESSAGPTEVSPSEGGESHG